MYGTSQRECYVSVERKSRRDYRSRSTVLNWDSEYKSTLFFQDPSVLGPKYL